ncbi:KxYKxGKxW signal peptide domain-containing protein [Limosilactobacillus sp.]|uniref:KxYKxGKxW signal peptide domain-containing protein n=1 Tax=Limosilactobacillus sp. TaxID=2773925 RepID=UPI00345EB65A
MRFIFLLRRITNKWQITMNKQHYKLYKSGKLWVNALVASATLAMGVITQTTEQADTNIASY